VLMLYFIFCSALSAFQRIAGLIIIQIFIAQLVFETDTDTESKETANLILGSCEHHNHMLA